MPDLSLVAQRLKYFCGDPQKAGPLASVLGFQPTPSPVDLLAGHVTPLSAFFNFRTDRFGVLGLYRVGGLTADPGCVGLYVTIISNWGIRPHERDRARRRIARALIEHSQDDRSLFIMVPDGIRREAEFVLPRAGGDGTGRGPVATVRALVDLHEPTRFHRELLSALWVRPGAALREVSELWQKTFSVERVTRAFYQEYAAVRNVVARALKESNPDHPYVRRMTDDQCRAWATRQMGRMLFLWFLQAKRWLGYDGTGLGSPTYLLDLWAKRNRAPGGYYRGLLTRLFFEGMALRRPGPEVRDLLGPTPYLNGGLFRRNKLEDDVEAAGPVALPDDAFDPEREMTALNLLSRYRFTTRESTPDDQSVDPDPELLGRVFENLYQGDERHDTGTYYTPREVVHFMCRQALDGYLRDVTGVQQEVLDRLRRVADEPVEDGWSPGAELEDKLVDALENVRVCDPAVGSGAFLVGMMHEIVHLRRGLMHTKGAYVEREEDEVAKWKRRAIQWSLYGVDINPEAVDICQLRLWLSLVLDHDDPRTFDPLPNLDFRVVAGDSLVDRVAGIPFTASLPQGSYQPPLELQGKVAREQALIERWKREFEGTQEDPKRLKELRDKIGNAQTRIVRHHLEAELKEAKEETQYRSGAGNPKKAAEARARVAQLEGLLRQLGPEAPYQKPFLWPVAFFEVFEPPSSGFDIVLANPPYVRQEKLDPEDQKSYQQAFPEVYSGTADILVFFYARAVQILRDGGWLSFITSNKYMRAAYGEGIRGHLASVLGLQRVTDFGDLPLFEAGGKPVAAYPAVLVGRRDGGEGDNNLQVADLAFPIRAQLAKEGKPVNQESVRQALEGLERMLADYGHGAYPQVLLRKEGWVLEDPALVRLFHRLMNTGTPLGEFVKGRIYYGVKTGLNEAFVIDQAKRDELVAEDPRSAEVIKPWLRGRDIKRWKPEWAGLYVIAIQSSGDSDASHPWAKAKTEAKAREMFRDAYPAIHEHLSWFEKKLRPRADQGRFWWELRACTYYSEFARPKVIWPDITRAMRFAWDSRGHFSGNTTYFTPRLQPWTVTALNSSVFEFLLCMVSNTLRGGYLRMFIDYLEVLPLPTLQEGARKMLNDAVLHVADDANIDNDLVTSTIQNSFGLSDSDWHLIRQWVSRRNPNVEGCEEVPDDDD
ncbi:MAG: TaqI-like C-terminal specificity domain-containing protein [Chloroflexota bacterium]